MALEMFKHGFVKEKLGKHTFIFLVPIWFILLYTRFIYRIVIFAGDVTPIDIMCHIPGVCEEKNIPYCYTPSRQDIGGAMGVKRGSLMVLVREHEEYKDLYDECQAEIKTLAVEL